MRRSVDGGASWGAATTLLTGNLDFYTAVRCNNTGIVWVTVQMAGQSTPVVVGARALSSRRAALRGKDNALKPMLLPP